MTIHIFKQEDITPETFSINLRSYLDTSGPHMLAMGTRTTVSAGPAGSILLTCRYEDISGNVQGVQTTGPSDLTTTDPSAGATWYMKDSLIMDRYYPLGNGPLVEPYGLFVLEFNLFGIASTSKFSYEAVLQTFDGSSSVQFHP